MRGKQGSTGREPVRSPGGFSRRRMVGYLIAGPTLIAGASLSRPAKAGAMVPTVQPVDSFDLSDLLVDSTLATNHMITIEVRPDGTVYFDLPRAEVGQGITTSFAMIIADEMDVPLDRVVVTLADAKPELLFNQFTGGSVSTQELYLPVRQAAATARDQMMRVAADRFGVARSELRVADGVISGGGQSLTFGELSQTAAVSTSRRADDVQLKQASDLKYIGTEQKRLDARAAVTGTKAFAMDLKVPDALPTVICRAPTINGGPGELLNRAEILAMPGVTDVQVIPHTASERNGIIQGGVAVRAKTFGQCIDAVRAMNVRWIPGEVSQRGLTVDKIKADLKAAELPMTPALPGQNVVEDEFVFHFRPGDPLEPNCAVADVREDRAEVWSALKSPIWAKQRIAANLNLPPEKVTVHVAQGGGSFGRHLFSDAAFEAAHVSRAFGNKPVKLMWTRADMPRHGRCQPMKIVRNRATHDGSQVTSFSQRMTGVMTDYTQGLGEILTAAGATPPGQNFLQYSQTIYNLTANVPYNFGPVDMLLNEIYEYNTFNTSSVRNILSPEVRTSVELTVDRLCAELGKDRMAFRIEHARDARMKAVLERVKKESQWGRALPAGVAQGVACHREYKGFAACVAEVDVRPKTLQRQKVGGKTGPRVTRVTYVVDVGLPINVLGLKAQMMGGIIDGIGQVMTYCLHLKDGAFLEASWDNAFYTRQWNVPPRVDVIVMPPTSDRPGGAGEFGVAASMAATACGYGAATGTMPRTFPVTYDDLGFKPYPTVPPVPESPTNGRKYRNAPKQR
jgi:isoquinoline 1-oxidoreductase subunit beta